MSDPAYSPSDTPTTPIPNAGYDTAAVQRRTLRTLWAASLFSRGAVSTIFVVAVLAFTDLLGSARWAGLSSVATTVGASGAALWLASYMYRKGRNPGLSLGFGVAVVGVVIATVGIEMRSALVLLAGMVAVGVGNGTSNLSRYAAADLAEPERRSLDISTVVFAATFGAVLFPLLIGVVNGLAADAGLNERSGGMILGGFLFLAATAAVRVFMRPDPLVIAGGLAEVKADSGSTKRADFRRAIAIAWEHPLARLAFVALVISQAVMVMVMAMTPPHMDAHGHGDSAIGQVISAHTLGMFAFAPLAGWMSDRFGRVPVVVLAGITLVAATILTSLAGEAPRLLMFPGLYLLGLGWSFGIVAGSALLTESVPEEHRVVVQGAADMATNIASGVGALASGLVVSMAGFHVLSIIGTIAAAGLLGQSWFEQRIAVLR